MEGFMEVELMVTKRDDDRRQQGEYRAICLWKMDQQSFAIHDQPLRFFKMPVQEISITTNQTKEGIES